MDLLLKLGYKNMGCIRHMEPQFFRKWTTPVTEEEITGAVQK